MNNEQPYTAKKIKQVKLVDFKYWASERNFFFQTVKGDEIRYVSREISKFISKSWSFERIYVITRTSSFKVAFISSFKHWKHQINWPIYFCVSILYKYINHVRSSNTKRFKMASKLSNVPFWTSPSVLAFKHISPLFEFPEYDKWLGANNQSNQDAATQ